MKAILLSCYYSVKRLSLLLLCTICVFTIFAADPSVDDVIFKEEWGGNNIQASAYTFTGTTTWSGSTTGLSYSSTSTSSLLSTATAKPLTSDNFFFVKSPASTLTMSGIAIPSNVTKISISFVSNKTNINCTYSFTGGEDYATGATSVSGTQSFEISCTGESTLYLKFSKTGTSSNARLDDIIITVTEVSSGGTACEKPSNVAQVKGSVNSSQQIDVSWTKATDVTQYDIYYNTSNSNSSGGTLLSKVDYMAAGSTYSYTIDNLTPSGTYYVWVRSHCGDGDGEQSSWVAASPTSVTLDAAPIDIKLSRNGSVTTIEGVAVGYTLPAATSDEDEQGGCADWRFIGWSKSTAAQTNTSALTLVTEADAAGTYYAVYKHTEGGGSGASGTLVASDIWSNGEEADTQTVGDITVTWDAGDNSNAPKYYSSGTAVRAYGGNTFTVSSTKDITSITLTFGSSDGSNEITASVGTYSSGTWTGEAKEVTFTIGGTSGHRRIASITAGAGGTTYYSTTASCGPTIVAEEDEYWVTSTKDVSVKLTIPVTAKRFTKTDSEFNISVETSDLSILSSPNGTAIGTTDTEGTLVLEFTPSEYNYSRDIEVTLADKQGYVGATAPTITVHARSLPEEFVLVAKNGSDYYALPAVNFSGTTAATYEAIPVTPESDMSKVKAVSSTLVYGLTGVATSNYATAGQYVRLFGNEGKMLTAGSDTKINNDAKYTGSSTAASYHWELITTDGVTYKLRNVNQNATLKYYAGENKFGKYTSGQETFYILPFDCKSLPIRVSEEETQDGAVISFTESANEDYTIIVKKGSTTVATYSEVESPHTITGLDGTTDYTYYITPSDESDPCAYSGSFTTLAAPFTVVLSYEGGTDNVTVAAGATFTLPTQAAQNGYPKAVADACDDWKFAGWTTENLASDNTTKPTSYATTATAAETYQAVYVHTDSETGSTGSYSLSYSTDVSSKSIAYESEVEVTATDGSTWIVMASKQNGMQINTGKSAYIKVPDCPGNITSVKIECYSTYNTVAFSTVDYTDSSYDAEEHNIAVGSNAQNQTLDLSSQSVTTGYIVPYGGNCQITSITVNYGGGTTYYSTQPTCCTIVTKPEVTVGAKGTSATFLWNEQANATSYELTVTTEAVGAPTPTVGATTATGATVTNLQTATTYQYTLKVTGKDGEETCDISVSDEFETEQTSMVISGWTLNPTTENPDSGQVILDLNEAIDAVLILEGDHKETEEITQHFADSLFFSKYFEADSENKLIALYNGTKDTIDLSKYQLHRTGISSSSVSLTKLDLGTYGRHKVGAIAPNEEIIIIRYSNTSARSAKSCASAQDGYENWYVETSSEEKNFLNFSGPMSIGLWCKSANKYIDVIGSTLVDNAGDEGDGTGDLIQILSAGATSKTGICQAAKKDFNDAGGFYSLIGDNVKTDVVETDYALSTNRCLLVRKNTVTSGLNAIKQNVYNSQLECSSDIAESFKTLATEWRGYRIGAESTTADSTCQGLGYVGGYDYNTYYSKMDTIVKPESLEKFKSAEDGTYHVGVGDLATRSCTNVRIEVKDNNTGRIISATRQVPIFVTEEGTTTTDQIFIDQDEKCATCDVVIMSKATLQKAADDAANDYPQVHNIEVYPGGALYVPTGTHYTINQLLLRSTKDEVPIVDIQGTLTRENGYIFHSKRIDNKRWYNFSLPYNCRIEDVHFNTGAEAVYGIDWLLQTYDGKRRATEQGAAEAYAGKNWKTVDKTEEPIIKAGYGYMIAIDGDENVAMQELVFPPYTAYEEPTEIDVKVGAWGRGTDLTPNNKGWNLVGSPFLSQYTKNHLNDNDAMTLGELKKDEEGVWTRETTSNLPYVTVPVDGGQTKYTHAKVSEQALDPFKSYFVQVGGDAGEEVTEATYQIEFQNAYRQKLGAPRRIIAEQKAQPIYVGVELQNEAGETDETALVIGEDYTSRYEMMADLAKWRGSMYKRLTQPVLMSEAEDGTRSFNAISEDLAEAGVPLTYFIKDKGVLTFRLSPTYSWADLEEVMLYDVARGEYTNLLTDDYEFYSDKGEQTKKFYLSAKVRHAPQIVTDLDNQTTGASVQVVDKTLLVSGLSTGAQVYVYDMAGKMVVSTTAAEQQIRLPLPAQGVYNVRVVSDKEQKTLKTVVK